MMKSLLSMKPQQVLRMSLLVKVTSRASGHWAKPDPSPPRHIAASKLVRCAAIDEQF